MTMTMQGDDETLLTNNVRHLHSVTRDTSPGEQGWAELRNRPDPLRSATASVLAAIMLGTLAWALHDTNVRLLALAPAAAFLAAVGMLSLEVGRALVRGRAIEQWATKRTLRREVDVERRRHATLGWILIGAAEDAETDFDTFAVRAAAYARTIRSDCGIVVARVAAERYLVEGVGGRVGTRAMGIRRGKSCPADRPFPVVLRHVGEASLAGKARSRAGETFWLGIVLGAPISKNEREALETVGSLFTMIVAAAEPQESSPSTEIDPPQIRLA